MIELLLILSLASFSISCIGFTQSVAVRGVLMCHGKPAYRVKVKLYDDDAGPDLDDLMDQTVSYDDGFFIVRGNASELTTIDPKINIYHDCNDGITLCQRRLTIHIPKWYVSYGKNPDDMYDTGTIELAAEVSGESRDCFH